jgi:hypothetical protein
LLVFAFGWCSILNTLTSGNEEIRFFCDHSAAYRHQTLRINRMASMKEGKVTISARTREKVDGWREKRARYSGSTVSAEISSAVLEKIGQEWEARAAKQPALAPAGA